jgi:hypothetical protein
MFHDEPVPSDGVMTRQRMRAASRATAKAERQEAGRQVHLARRNALLARRRARNAGHKAAA